MFIRYIYISNIYKYISFFSIINKKCTTKSSYNKIIIICGALRLIANPLKIGGKFLKSVRTYLSTCVYFLVSFVRVFHQTTVLVRGNTIVQCLKYLKSSSSSTTILQLHFFFFSQIPNSLKYIYISHITNCFNNIVQPYTFHLISNSVFRIYIIYFKNG